MAENRDEQRNIKLPQELEDLRRLAHNVLDEAIYKIADMHKETFDDVVKSVSDTVTDIQEINSAPIVDTPVVTKSRRTVTLKPLAELGDGMIRLKYYTAIKNGEKIDDALNAEMGRRFPTYNMVSQKFEGKRGGARRRSKKTDNVQEKPRKTNARGKPLSEWKDSSLRLAYSKAIKFGPENISDELNTELAKRFRAYNPILRRFVKMPPVPSEKPVKQEFHVNNDTRVLNVTLKQNKMTLDGGYNDVYVNGTRIIRNHVNTRLETFMDGAYLGIHGTPTDDKTVPSVPMWYIYDTDMKLRRVDSVNSFTKKNVYIQRVTPANGGKELALYISNKMIVTLKRGIIKRVFQIESEKTK